MNETIKILGLESSCDETSAAVIEVAGDDLKCLGSVISSQVNVHAKYGGVVPEVAARLHIEKILPLIKESLKNANCELKDIDAIAACSGPGLISSLIIGVETGKTLAVALNKPLIRVNHIEGHILSVEKDKVGQIKLPAVALVVSGGHTQLILMKDYGEYELIGGTRDDAAGEAFDKAAKILDLGYPGGPAISKEAMKAGGKNEFDIKMPRPMLESGDFNFSFSGIKTAVLYKWNDLKKNLSEHQLEIAKADLAFEFQQAATEVLVEKSIQAAEKYGAKTVILAGGVSANKTLREFLGKAVSERLPGVEFRFPEMQMTGDNAAMIAVAGYYHYKIKDFADPLNLTADPNWELV